MIRAWRLVKSRHAATAFDGEGAWLHGARWNSPGTRVAYASENMALAVLEVLVHLQSSATLDSYSCVGVRFPPEIIEDLDLSAIPARWRRYPAPRASQAIGDAWVRELRSAVLRVPSVIVPSADNFLLNPAHADSTKVVVEPPAPFEFDPRLLKY